MALLRGREQEDKRVKKQIGEINRLCLASLPKISFTNFQAQNAFCNNQKGMFGQRCITGSVPPKIHLQKTESTKMKISLVSFGVLLFFFFFVKVHDGTHFSTRQTWCNHNNPTFLFPSHLYFFCSLVSLLTVGEKQTQKKNS